MAINLCCFSGSAEIICMNVQCLMISKVSRRSWKRCQCINFCSLASLFFFNCLPPPYLFKGNADLEALDSNGSTPLICACSRSIDVDVIQVTRCILTFAWNVNISWVQASSPCDMTHDPNADLDRCQGGCQPRQRTQKHPPSLCVRLGFGRHRAGVSTN